MTWSNKYADLALGDGESGAGTLGDPWSIQKAASIAASEDFVWVKAATAAVLTSINGAAFVIAGSGVVQTNRKIIFKCYNTTPGDATAGNFVSDMDKGGDYYQGPLDVLINGVTAAKSGDVSAPAGGHLLSIIGQDNIEFHNFYFHDVSTINRVLVTFASTPVEILFHNCKFDDAKNCAIVTGDSIKFIDCYVGDAIVTGPLFDITGSGTLIRGCVFNAPALATSIEIAIGGDGIVAHNLIIGGGEAVLARGRVIIISNTCYNQTTTCIRVHHSTVVISIWNNIFSPAAIDDLGVLLTALGGSVLYNNHNCFYCVDAGAVLTKVMDGDSQDPLIGANSIQEDPDFVDEGNYDFTPQNENVLFGAKGDPETNQKAIGSIDPLYLKSDGSPSAPSITLTPGTGQITITIDGDAGVTHYVKYKGSGDTAWQDGGSRSGDGDVTVSSLSNDIPYIFIVYSQKADGQDWENAYSPPALAMLSTLSAATSNDNETYLSSAFDDMLDEFGEAVTYKPAGGGTRAITAIIDRQAGVDIDGLDYISSPEIQVHVKNDSTDGITASEIDTGGDEISMPIRQGETAQDRRINKVVFNDAVSLILEVQ